VSDIQITKTVSITAQIPMTEGELRALTAIACYGADAFLKVFYERLGKAYLGPFEQDMRALFGRIAHTVEPALVQVKEAREYMELK
jgi:hypothetical protein